MRRGEGEYGSYALSYLECSCPKVKCGLRSNPEQCECSRQSILYILSQLEPDSQFDVRIENTILRGSDRCTFRITRNEGLGIDLRVERKPWTVLPLLNEVRDYLYKKWVSVLCFDKSVLWWTAGAGTNKRSLKKS